MIKSEQESVSESAVAMALKLETGSMKFSDIEPFDVTVESTIDGKVSEIRLAMGQGPHTEIEVGSGMVAAYSHGCSSRVHFNNEELANELWDHWTDIWGGNQ